MKAARIPTYGWPRVHAELTLGLGLVVDHKRVARLMREAGVQGLYRRRSRGCTIRHQHADPYEGLADRDFVVDGPNDTWCTDITEHPHPGRDDLLCGGHRRGSRPVSLDDRAGSGGSVVITGSTAALKGFCHGNAGAAAYTAAKAGLLGPQRHRHADDPQRLRRDMLDRARRSRANLANALPVGHIEAHDVSRPSPGSPSLRPAT
ncbi:hypothetical protein GCM10009836_24870 [Pseudonocardia ailaonensis]|uniref:HTH-like domain-containing protein n=1 Tax=Pseudonocardia ailaonensis TaxID=367279 RepID=A0ABN2N1J3_9PSEU